MWKCPRPLPNHKGTPQLSLCRGGPINTFSPPVFCLLAAWLRRAAFNAGTGRWGWGATTRHIITSQTKPFAFSCIFLFHGWLQVMQCPLSKFKEFIVVPVSVDGTDFLCTVVKHPKVACERSNTAWIQKLRLFNECVQRCIIPVRENLRYMLDRWDGKGAFTAGK